MKKVILFIVLLIAVVPSMGDQKAEKIIVYATPWELDANSYWVQSTYSDIPWISAVYSGLYKRDNEFNRTWVPSLASELPMISGSEFTVPLRKDAKFSNGSPVTADDVIFSYKVALTPEINQLNYLSLSKYLDNSSLIKIDDYTVKFVFNKLTGFALTYLSVAVVPKIIYEGKYLSCISGNSADCDWNDPNGADAISAGPYMVESMNQDVVTVVKNPNYWDTVIADKIVFKTISDRKQASAAVVSGDVDILDVAYLFSLDDFNESSVHKEIVPSFSHQEISLNHLSPYWGDGSAIPDGDPSDDAIDALLIRRAMSHIVDRDFIVEQGFKGLAMPASSTFPPASIGWNPDLKPNEYNITLAKELMIQAGFNYSLLNDTDNDGVYDTFFFNLTVLVPNIRGHVISATLFAEELPKIGIGVDDFVIAEWNTILPRTFFRDSPPGLYAEGGFDIFFVAYGWEIDWNPEGVYDSQGLIPNGTNFYNYINYTLDGLIQSYLLEIDPTARIRKAHEIQKAIHDDLPVIPISYQKFVWIWNENIRGLSPILLMSRLQEWNEVYKINWDFSNSSTNPPSTSTSEPPKTTSTSNSLVFGWAAPIVVFIVPSLRKIKRSILSPY